MSFPFYHLIGLMPDQDRQCLKEWLSIVSSFILSVFVFFFSVKIVLWARLESDVHLLVQDMGLLDQASRLEANFCREKAAYFWEDSWWRVEKTQLVPLWPLNPWGYSEENSWLSFFYWQVFLQYLSPSFFSFILNFAASIVARFHEWSPYLHAQYSSIQYKRYH